MKSNARIKEIYSLEDVIKRREKDHEFKILLDKARLRVAIARQKSAGFGQHPVQSLLQEKDKRIRLAYCYLQNKAKQRMPFDGKITVELKGEMTTEMSSNTIKVFYHPLSVVTDVEKEQPIPQHYIP